MAQRNHVAVREHLAQQDCKNCTPEEAKALLDAFTRVFLEMKIQHIYDPADELEFSFSRGPRCDRETIDCGKDEEKWRDETKLKAA
jgi:hypothetical protein